MAQGVTMRMLRWVGLALSVVAIGFIGLRFRDYASQLTELELSATSIAALALMVFAYAVANLPLAAAWRKLLAHLGESRDLAWAVGVYGQSQLAKYIPGNVFHIAGRQALGMAEGVPPGRMAKSAIWELGTISTAAATFAVLLVFSGDSPGDAIAFGLVTLAAGIGLHRLVSCSVAIAFLMYVVFFLVSGALFLGILQIVDPGSTVGLATVFGAYVVAWLAGMATPGAPAGLGVREVFLYGILHTSISQADLLLAIAMSRLVTAGGDLVFYLAATLAPARR